MTDETLSLARFAAELRFDALPDAVVRRSRDGIADTVAAMLRGATTKWGQTIAAYAHAAGPGGRCAVFAEGGGKVQPGAAALANGTLAHSFELDLLTSPSSGSHPGANVVPAVLAVGQHIGASGRDALLAFAVGIEVLNRVGRAGPVHNKFHKPGVIGPFGAAAAAGSLLRLDAAAMTNALGIAGSLGCGLMEFARTGNGAMVKRLHLGRSAESGVLAALLAKEGFTGPDTVIEGAHGFLAGFCEHITLQPLVAGLGETWETLTLSLKRFACHVTAQLPVQAALDLKTRQAFDADDVVAITVSTFDKRVAARQNILEPADLMMAQYSVPFCVALAILREPRDPDSFSEASVADPAIRSLCRRVEIVTTNDREVVVSVRLADGRILEGRAETYEGTPAHPLDDAGMMDKFVRVAGAGTAGLCRRLQHLEHESDLAWIGWQAA